MVPRNSCGRYISSNFPTGAITARSVTLLEASCERWYESQTDTQNEQTKPNETTRNGTKRRETPIPLQSLQPRSPPPLPVPRTPPHSTTSPPSRLAHKGVRLRSSVRSPRGRDGGGAGRALLTGGGIACGVVLDLGVHLGAAPGGPVCLRRRFPLHASQRVLQHLPRSGSVGVLVPPRHGQLSR